MVRRSRRRPPTEEQMQRMRQYGLPVLATDALCGQAIRFVRQGENGKEQDQPNPQHLSLAQRFLGAEVNVKDKEMHRETGRVVGIRIRKPSQIAAVKKKSRITMGQIIWVVQLCDRQVQVSPTHLKVLTPVKQKQLF